MQDERVAALLDDGGLRSGMFDAIGAKHAAGPGARMGIRGLGDRHRGLRGGGNAGGIGGTDTRGVAGGDRRCGRGGADVGAKRHASAIRHCDQRERNKDPGLAGKVVMRFTTQATEACPAST
ncbi:MAG: hypothetical protein VX265_05700 [Myxococcota bacterium]|nr:hypothetical protein [Myxococcota bacterium]